MTHNESPAVNSAIKKAISAPLIMRQNRPLRANRLDARVWAGTLRATPVFCSICSGSMLTLVLLLSSCQIAGPRYLKRGFRRSPGAEWGGDRDRQAADSCYPVR